MNELNAEESTTLHSRSSCEHA